MTLGDFSSQAAAYQNSRPGYPPELLQQLIADANAQPGDPVADFGAGTGIMTQLLVDRGFLVTAVEPNAPMRLRANVTSARWIDGTFEQCPLPDMSQRWIVAAQAFHWADPARSLPELRRILQPRCCLTVLWNRRQDHEHILTLKQAK